MDVVRGNPPCSCAATRSRRPGAGSSRSGGLGAVRGAAQAVPGRQLGAHRRDRADRARRPHLVRGIHDPPSERRHALNPVIAEVTERIAARSTAPAAAYLEQAGRGGRARPAAHGLSCGNLAHVFAACGTPTRRRCAARSSQHRIVTAYNDMLSAHQPYRALSRPAHARPRARPAPWPRSPAACPRCATASPRAARHGAVAVQPRRDRHGDGGRAQSTTCSTAR